MQNVVILHKYLLERQRKELSDAVLEALQGYEIPVPEFCRWQDERDANFKERLMKSLNIKK